MVTRVCFHLAGGRRERPTKGKQALIQASAAAGEGGPFTNSSKKEMGRETSSAKPSGKKEREKILVGVK